jgi:hypothetical protein
MLTYKHALTLAETWVRVCCGDGVQIIADKVTKKPYGWIFFYQSSEFIASGDHRNALAGNAPIIVDRVDGEVRVTGTAKPLSDYLAKYEATLPKARLEMSLPSEP